MGLWCPPQKPSFDPAPFCPTPQCSGPTRFYFKSMGSSWYSSQPPADGRILLLVLFFLEPSGRAARVSFWLPSNLQEPGEVLRREPLLLSSINRVPGLHHRLCRWSQHCCIMPRCCHRALEDLSRHTYTYAHTYVYTHVHTSAHKHEPTH